jgi:hypothetical protein
MLPWIELDMDLRCAVLAAMEGIEARLRIRSSEEAHNPVLLVGSTRFPREGLSYFAYSHISLADNEQDVLQRHILRGCPDLVVM